jgi:predicted transposase YbfD/YdcC
MIIAERFTDLHTSTETRYFISSLPASAEPHLQAIRDHRGIENSLHWVLDLTFNEDRSRVRKDHAPANLAVLRHMTVNLLKQEKTANGGFKAKRLQAALDEAYLLKVLSA